VSQRKDGRPRKRRIPPPALVRGKRVTASTDAGCSDCEWIAVSTNALAVASLHARATGHEVEATRTLTIIYNPMPEAPGDF
jgi:hypothetical protein